MYIFYGPTVVSEHVCSFALPPFPCCRALLCQSANCGVGPFIDVVGFFGATPLLSSAFGAAWGHSSYTSKHTILWSLGLRSGAPLPTLSVSMSLQGGRYMLFGGFASSTCRCRGPQQLSEEARRGGRTICVTLAISLLQKCEKWHADILRSVYKCEHNTRICLYRQTSRGKRGTRKICSATQSSRVLPPAQLFGSFHRRRRLLWCDAALYLLLLV